MKNPYRQLKQLPLRNAAGWGAGVLFLAKSILVLAWFTNPEGFRNLPGRSYGPLVVAISGVPDLLVLFFLTVGWYDLYRRAWAILPGAFVNLGICALAVTVGALELVGGPHSLREKAFLGILVIIPLALAIVQLVASLRLYGRIKPSAPPML